MTLDYNQEPLNDILLDLNDRFRVQISINSSTANNCLITIDQAFESMEKALRALADRCELDFVKIADVYVFNAKPVVNPETEKPQKRPPQYLYQGLIVENGTDEPLPFSLIKLENGGVVSDENGRFSFKSQQQEERGIFRYLGYEPADTLVSHSNSLVIALDPKLVELGEIEVVSPRGLSPLTNIGGSAGYIRFNDISNNLVPGLSDNLIFNNLRLYPGVMAAGESIADFVIWGSYAGQTHVTYDGISMFNSWGVNDDMGRVNPYMIKNVEVYKGGYNVQYGDRIGGVVMMDSRSGNKNKAGGSISLTNQLGNAYLNVPLFNNSATLQLAGRKTIFDDFDLATGFDQNIDLIVPKYDYSDFNLKFSASFANSDQLEISSIYSEDTYSGNVVRPQRRDLVQDIGLNSKQSGASLKYSKNWDKGGISNLLIARSNYDPQFTANYFLDIGPGPTGDTLRSYNWTNPIEEFKTSLTHTFVASQHHQIQLSGSVIHNNVSLKSNADQRVIENTSEESRRLSLYAHDQIQWSNNFSMQLGLKADMPKGSGKIFIQPRVNVKVNLSPRWNIHGAWGLYNQFVSKNSVIDELGNRSEVWQITDGTNAAALKSEHNVLGFNYTSSFFEFGLEGFYKNSSGFSRFFLNRNGNTIFVTGEARTKGLEVFARKKVWRHEFWVSYTLSEVEERFSNRNRVSDFQLAPQSQRHELKAVAAFDFSPVQLSITNVYGSGFPNSTLIRAPDEFEAYWRTDLALQYRFGLEKLDLEAGLSILNLFNNRNVRLNQSINSPNGARINTVGIPFTPTLYFNLTF